jgi:HTH-type transcriptional regulator/antitoxin HipB
MRQLIRTPAQVGQLLQGQRKRLGLSQTELGTRVGLSQKRLSALELAPDRITLDQLLRMLAALELELVIQDKAASEPTSKPGPSREW